MVRVWNEYFSASSLLLPMSVTRHFCNLIVLKVLYLPQPSGGSSCLLAIWQRGSCLRLTILSFSSSVTSTPWMVSFCDLLQLASLGKFSDKLISIYWLLCHQVMPFTSPSSQIAAITSSTWLLHFLSFAHPSFFPILFALDLFLNSSIPFSSWTSSNAFQSQ